MLATCTFVILTRPLVLRTASANLPPATAHTGPLPPSSSSLRIIHECSMHLMPFWQACERERLLVALHGLANIERQQPSSRLAVVKATLPTHTHTPFQNSIIARARASNRRYSFDISRGDKRNDFARVCEGRQAISLHPHAPALRTQRRLVLRSLFPNTTGRLSPHAAWRFRASFDTFGSLILHFLLNRRPLLLRLKNCPSLFLDISR